jgi:hypothetical protein
MSLEFLCRWNATVVFKEILKHYLKYLGSIFYCRWSSSVF